MNGSEINIHMNGKEKHSPKSNEIHDLIKTSSHDQKISQHVFNKN